MLFDHLPGAAGFLGSGVFSIDSLGNPLPDLFGSDSIDDGIEHGRNQQVDISKHDVHNSGDTVAKTVSEEGEKGWNIESQDNTDMGSTCTKSFEAGFT